MDELPKQLPPQPKWATEVHDRRPKFKLHKTYGQVRNAIGYGSGWYGGGVRGGRVYEWVDGAWVLRWDIRRGTKKSEHEFFLGCDGGPQDVEKMAREAERRRRAEVERLERELARAKAELDGKA